MRRLAALALIAGAFTTAPLAEAAGCDMTKCREIRARHRCDQRHVLACIERAALHRGQSYGYMRSVAYCESRFNPYAVGGGIHHGLYQFLRSTWATTPYGSRPIYSAKWNALAAAWAWQHGRIGEWACA